MASFYGHASQEAIKVAKQFVKGNAAKSPMVSISTGDYRYPDKGRRVTTDGQVYLSYDWWQAAFRDEDGSFWVTTDQYQTGEWKSGKPKYSPTTNGHTQAVRDELHMTGYEETEETLETGGRHYVKWIYQHAWGSWS